MIEANADRSWMKMRLCMFEAMMLSTKFDVGFQTMLAPSIYIQVLETNTTKNGVSPCDGRTNVIMLDIVFSPEHVFK